MKRTVKILKKYEYRYPEHLHGLNIEIPDSVDSSHYIIPVCSGAPTASGIVSGIVSGAALSMMYTSVDLRHTNVRKLFSPLWKVLND